MFNVGFTPYGTILYNTRTMKVGILRQQKIKNPVQPEKANRVHHLWVTVINLIEDDTWAELWRYRDDQTPITDFTNWVYPDVNTIKSDDPVADYIYELGKFYSWQDMMESPKKWFINAIEDGDVEEFYMYTPRDMWEATKVIMGNRDG